MTWFENVPVPGDLLTLHYLDFLKLKYRKTAVCTLVYPAYPTEVRSKTNHLQFYLTVAKSI